MDFHRVFVQNPLFDYLRFYDEGLFTDCEIHVFDTDPSDYKTIRAHRLVLANSSAFFENLFTSGMKEASTGVIDAPNIPFPEFQQVIRFLYSGTASLPDDTLMLTFFIARHFGIPSLLSYLKDYLTRVPATAMLGFVAQCFDYELVDELMLLEPIIAKHYPNLSMRNLSSALDVATFVHVLKLVEKTTVEKVNDLESFLGGWKCSPAEKAEIGELFKSAGPNIQALLRQKGANWLPHGFKFAV
jgi:hypothetical protein